MAGGLLPVPRHFGHPKSLPQGLPRQVGVEVLKFHFLKTSSQYLSVSIYP